MIKRLFLLACCLIGTLTLTAQEISLTGHISSADGLSNDFVISIAVDGKGPSCGWPQRQA